MIVVIFAIVIHSYYLPKNKYCHLNNINNNNDTNSDTNNTNTKNNNKRKKNTTDVLENFNSHNEGQMYFKGKDLKKMTKDTKKLLKELNKQSEKTIKFKDKNNFYVDSANINSYKRLKKFIEDEKYNPRYHESLREYDRNYKIDQLEKDYLDILSKKNESILAAQKGKMRNIKSYNANHYIRVAQPRKLNNVELKNTNKLDNLNNPFTIFVNKGCLSFNNENDSFKVSNMCNLTDRKQQFKLNNITKKEQYNKIVEDSGNEFLYSLPTHDENINLDQPFYVIHPIDNSEDNSGENLNKNKTKCLTQLGEHLSVEPCNLHTNQRWLVDFKDRQ
tara:strand:+ start:472 stop:1467 length:996 start_codon:yes stop_codon:yes gene_type:complete